MKIKRFFAADIRQAMRMVKDELGSDAVIMSNRSVDGGVEIVAARDFDEQTVHKNLRLQERETTDVSSQSALKKPELPGFEPEKKIPHLLSSSRKRGNEAETQTRRNLDKYVGYAEKVQIAAVAPAPKKTPEKIKLPEKPVWPASEQTLGQTRDNPRIAPLGFGSEKFMDEMRLEMKEMRALLDSKLSSFVREDQQPCRAALLERLTDAGFSQKLSIKIANRLGSHKDADTAFAKACEMLAGILPIADDTLLEQGGIAALVGPTGVGKTTTIAKLAAQYILKHGSRDVALITTDNYRIAAHEQLGIYGRILGVSVKIASDGDELHSHIQSFSDKRLILIDTVGMSQRDLRLAEQFRTLRHDDLPIRTYLVMSATSQYKTVMEIIEAYQILTPQAAILTKLDEAASKASALSAIIERRTPLSFVTDGQQVPEDIYAPEAETLVQTCLAGNPMETDCNDELNQDNWLVENYA